ncbi:uracil-DNA glycosylase [Nitratiruptor sp. YY08-26]|nr:MULTISPECIES: uracil-DNA glycosylase [unclassified Nitratiruptor]BCD62495.1 uracil-DNA glycosylase [Nitratiruptor sp. YY08-13]BCD66431.1 uracil-DNA glycosylase [Nitratiruptor sp. YY08-26]
MTQSQKFKILYNLYQQLWLGETYMNPITLKQPSHDKLPDDLEELRKIVLSCHLCDLSKTRKNVVFGEGNPHAKLMFVGEGPGATEDETGRPFVGRAGQLLTKMIENVLEISRSDVFIANIVKCRPPNNRVPTPEEVSKCIPYLFKQIEIINPKIIVALGSTSYKHLTGDNTPISKIRGEIIQFRNRILIPTFHPSFLLRNPSKKKEAYQDLLKIKELLCEIS